MKPVDLFHIGPQKSGTTWLYRALVEHPEVACPPRDSIHYFDMHYARGRDWYARHFDGASAGQLLFDPTPSYIRSSWAPRRIHAENPAARIALTLRNPLERAFSHYWHEKKKQRFDFGFDELLSNYDLYSSWLEPGFYAESIERFLEHFPREQLLVQRFEELGRDAAGFYAAFCAFAGIDPAHRPSTLDRRVNAAGARQAPSTRWRLYGKAALRRLRFLPGVAARVDDPAFLSLRAEYDRGIPDDLAQRIWELCEPEVLRLERLIGEDLSAWRP